MRAASTRSPVRVVGRVAAAALVVAAFGALVSLGTWQLHRLAWKEALIAAASTRPTLPPVDAPGPAAWPDLAMADWDYRSVRLDGRFAAEEAYAWVTLTSPKGAFGGQGAFVVAPFTTADGWTVFVNRGFVPDDRRRPDARPGSAPRDADVTLTGIVRQDDVPGRFTPAPDRATRLVFGRDVATLTGLFGLDPARVAPYTVDLDASQTPAGGLPQAGESLLTFTNTHLEYALTWYGLAAALVGVVTVALWRRRRAH